MVIESDMEHKAQDILIIAHFTQVPGEHDNGRFHYIASHLSKENMNVEIVTSNFSHRTKRRRDLTKEQCDSINYKLTLLNEPPYVKNISLKRFISHFILAKNVKNFLKKRKNPDILYCSVPSLSVAAVAAKYAKKNNVEFIIDIQDLWPEAFKMVFDFKFISNLIFLPMTLSADFIYNTADKIFAVSNTYVNRALKSDTNSKHIYSIFLGTDLDNFDNLSSRKGLFYKPDNEFWLVYIGTLSYSYNIKLVIDALSLLKDTTNKKRIKFIIMGDGPLKNMFEAYCVEKQVYSEFTGKLQYDTMVTKLSLCDLAINPIVPGSAGSILNKVGDYAAAGLPVINTQECIEYCDLLDEYESGINCTNDINSARKAIDLLYNNEVLRKKIGKNSRKLAEEKFDRKKTYKKIFEALEGGLR